MPDHSYSEPANINPILFTIARLGVQHAVKGLSDMVGEELASTEPEVNLVPVLEVPDFVGALENDAVGVYLRGTGDAAGQFMFIMPFENSLEVIDLVMGEAPGTTTKLDDMGCSALAELGNLAGTFFLNALAELTGLESRPSEPAVLVDMMGAILSVVVSTSVEQVEEIIIINTTILRGNLETRTIFWYIPDPLTMKRINDRYAPD